MKFTAYQSEYITKYLIHQGLEYKEFIDEMHDHFCGSVEVKMNEGLNFHQAVSATKEEFNEEIYRPKLLPFFPKKGLKAMERRFYESKKRESNTELERNFKATFFSIPNALVVCYVGLVFFLFSEYSLKNSSLIHFWIWPFHAVVFYVRKRIKGNLGYETGAKWLFATKQQRVRSIYVNLVFQAFNNRILLFFMFVYFPVTFLLRQDVISSRMHGYFTLIGILITLLACVQVVRNLHGFNRRISLDEETDIR